MKHLPARRPIFSAVHLVAGAHQHLGIELADILGCQSVLFEKPAADIRDVDSC
jgi:hypothetical protein